MLFVCWCCVVLLNWECVNVFGFCLMWVVFVSCLIFLLVCSCFGWNDRVLCFRLMMG